MKIEIEIEMKIEKEIEIQMNIKIEIEMKIEIETESSAEDWAVSYFEKHGVQHVTLQMFWEPLEHQFPPASYRSLFFGKLVDEKQKEDKTVSKFGLRLKDLQRDTRFPDSELKFVFQRGLKDILKKEIERAKGGMEKYETLDELKEAATKIETRILVQEERKGRKGDFKPHS